MFDVLGHGPNETSLMIVGDYPNPDEMESKLAFVGKTGNTASLLFERKQIYNEAYKTTLIKTYQPEFSKKLRSKREKAIKLALQSAKYEQTLREEIAGMNPNAILAFGDAAFHFLTGEKGLESYRGSILPVNPELRLPNKIKVISTLHPRSLWSRWADKPLVEHDVRRAVKYSKISVPYVPKGILWRVKNAKELQLYWSRASKGEYMVFDIETWRGYITCIGFCTDGREAVSVPFFDYATLADNVEVWKLLNTILQSNMPKINQNIKYDLHYLEKWGFRVSNVVGDTSLLARCIYPEFNVRLALLQSLYTELPYHKDEGHDYNPAYDRKETLYLYNAKDCLATWQVWKGQVKDAKEYEVFDFYQNNYVKNGLFDIYRKMDNRGIMIDSLARDKLLARYEGLLEVHTESIRTFYGQQINVNSPKQVADFVYEFLGCHKIYKRANDEGVRNLDTGKEALEELYINHVKDDQVKKILKQIILVRKIQTILGYVRYLVHPDGRLRTSTRLNGTKSGRTSQTSHEDSVFYTTEKGAIKYTSFGGSLQVIPKRSFEAEEFEGEVFGDDISEMFVPTPGYVFVEGDGGAAEARVVCVLANAFTTLENMDKTDIHRLTATWTLEKAFDQITSIERELYGKRPRHAGNYDMTAFRLALMIHKPVDLCAQILKRFHDNEPKIRAVFHTLVREIVTNTGCLVSPHGRLRQFFGRYDDKLFKEAYSEIPQATVSDHTKFTLPLIQKDVRSVEFLLEKHDSLLMEVPVVEKERLFEVFKKHMERPISFREGSFKRDFELVIPAEIKWSDENWRNMKKVKF